MLRLRVKEVAEAHGITSAAELARRSGLSFSTANQVWKGQVTIDGKRSVGILSLRAVARAIGVPIGDLYVDEDRASRYAATVAPDTA